MTNSVFLPGDWVTIKQPLTELIAGCYGIGEGTFEVIEYNKDCNHEGLMKHDLNVICVQCKKSVWHIAGSFKKATEEEIQTAKLLKSKDMIKKRLDKLPDCWHVIATKESIDALTKWREVHTAMITLGMLVGMCKTGSNSYEKGHNPGHMVKAWLYDFGKEISFDDFKRLVLNEYVFPENWAIKRTEDTDDIITNFINKTNNVNHLLFKDNKDCPWMHSGKSIVSGGSLRYGYEEINFDEFSKYVMKKTDNRSISSYKLIKELPTLSIHTIGDIVEHNLEFYSQFPEYWEPIYEEEFKLGDWITIIGERTGWLKEVIESTFQIVSPKESYCAGVYWGILQPTVGISGALCAKFRKATKEEIEKSKIPTIIINGYVGEFLEDSVEFGCAKFEKDIFIELNSIIQKEFLNTNRSIKSVTIGKGEFSATDIQNIVAYFDKKV